MNKPILGASFVCALLFLTGMQARADGARACILNFERLDYPISRPLEKGFRDDPGVRVIQNAVPADVLECADQGAREITIVAHSMESPRSPNEATLGYFELLQGQDRQDAIHGELERLASVKSSILTVLKEPRSDFSAALEENFEAAEKGTDSLAHVASDEPLYAPRIVHSQVFIHLLDRVKEEKAAGRRLPLVRLSIVACQPEKVLRHYPELSELRNYGVSVEFSPPNRFLSFFYRKKVTSPDLDWIRGSVSERSIKNLEQESPDETKARGDVAGAGKAD